MSDMNAVEYLTGLLSIYNYRDTKGLIFFRSGLVLKISSFFDYYQEQWSMFNRINSVGTVAEKEDFLEETDGGIITNGAITISLPDVIAMFKEGGESTSFMLPGSNPMATPED